MLHTFSTYLQRHTFTKRLCLVAMGYTLVTSACLRATEEDQGKTILRLVRQNNIKEVQNLLKENHQLVNKQDRRGRSALHWACDKKYLQMIQLCIQYGANVNAKDKYCQTPLFYILLWQDDKDKLEALSLLANCHVDSNAQNNRGETGLHIACLNEDILGADFLLRHGINGQLQEGLGNTALHRACLYDNLNLITVLTNVPDVGALLQIKNKKGKTPRAIAKGKGYKEIVAFLDTQAALSNKHFVATAGLTRENSSHVIDAIVYLIVSYLLFQRCSTT